MTAWSLVEGPPDDLRALRADPAMAAVENGPIYGRFGRDYCPEAAALNPVDRHFFVCAGARPILLADIDIADGTLGRYGRPGQFWFAPAATDAERAKAASLAMKRIEGLAEEGKLERIRLAERVAGPTLSPIGKICSDNGYRPGLRVVPMIDLTRDQDAIYADVRKSYKSLINWGRKAMHMSYVNEQNPDRALFDTMPAFHKHVAGKVTRSAKSWEQQFEAVAAGYGEASFGYDEADELVSAVLTVDGEKEAVYFSAVYDRDKFHKPIGHWPLWDAIVRSKARGRDRFYFGDTETAEPLSEKEEAIAFFKRGFAGTYLQEIIWSRSVA